MYHQTPPPPTCYLHAALQNGPSLHDCVTAHLAQLLGLTIFYQTHYLTIFNLEIKHIGSRSLTGFLHNLTLPWGTVIAHETSS